ncbi:MAG: BREX-3 system P-loop-containing protein BrxF [Magnetococcales bacterium]|nr:BREX-3 system P-loop-containing protein BrxF [Magnetococcales bacterium]
MMNSSKDQEILGLVAQAEGLYHRLVLVVGPSGSGKTMVLNKLAMTSQWSFINLSLELSRAMLDLTERQRPLRVQKLLEEIVGATSGAVTVLDNTEILFDVSLKLDPLRLLQAISRDRTVVASWNGLVANGYLTFASPEHQEFKRYPSHELLLSEIRGHATSNGNKRIAQ